MVSGFYARAASLLATAAILHIAGELIQRFGTSFAGSVTLELSFVLFALGFAALPAALGMTDRVLSQGAALCAFLGAIAGAAMQVHFRAIEALASADQAQAVAILTESSPLHFSTLVPGILFPIGMLALSVSLWSAKRTNLFVASTLAMGALLFPVGHAANVAMARFGSDTAVAVAFCFLAASPRRTES
jgi:hypothetical protein